MSLINQPFIQLLDANGDPYAGAKAYFFKTGTTTPAVVYQDAAFTSPHAIPVVADASGIFPAIFANATPVLAMKITSATGSLASPIINIDPVNGDSGGSSSAGAGANVVDNPSFCVSQRNGTTNTSVADDVYCLDRWYALTQTAAIQAQQIKDPEDGYTHYLRGTQNQVAAQRFGFAQIKEGKNCKHLRGGTATLVPRVRASISQPIRYAILGWTSTEDVVTSDVVNAWGDASFSPGHFFLGANVAVLAVGAATPNAAEWTTLPALTAVMGSAFNNIIVMIWTEGTAAQNFTLDLDYVKLEAGATATPFTVVDYATELEKCQRCCYVWAAQGAFDVVARGQQLATGSSIGFLSFPTSLRSGFTFTSSGAFGFGADDLTNQGAAISITASGLGGSPGDGKNGVGLSVASGGIAAGKWGWVVAFNDVTAKLKFDAEL